MRRRWLHARSIGLAVGLVSGALVGLAVYGGSLLTGAALYALCGTAAGGVAAVALYAYTQTARLTELTVTVPNLTSMTFAVTRPNESVAWRLFVEASTRISTQPLDPETGVIREALNSLYTLFQSVRAILLEAEPTTRFGTTQTVEHLAIGMLNVQMRPFMAKWHARLSEWERANPGAPEAQWPDKDQCRMELEAMRVGLLEYVRGLGELAGVRHVDDILGGPSDQEPVSR